MGARPIVGAVAVAVLLVTSACGSGASPADDVPALAAALDEVDDAIVAGDDEAARAAIAELTDVARQARKDGDLDESEADRITEAADALLEALSDGDTGEDEPAEPTPDAPTTSTPFDEDPDPNPKPGGKPDKPGKPEKPGKPDKGDDEDDDD